MLLKNYSNINLKKNLTGQESQCYRLLIINYLLLTSWSLILQTQYILCVLGLILIMPKSLIISPFENPNWFTAKGVSLKMKQITAKGIPDLRNCRFVTLTIDHKQHDSPVSAYLRGKRQMRQFIYELRAKLGVKFGYAWKLEFHESGYPHWHCILLFKKKLLISDLYINNESIHKQVYEMKALSKYSSI